MIPLFYLEHNMIFLEPRAIFDAAIVQIDPVVYEFDLLIEVMISAYEWTYTEAIEWYCHNIEPLKDYQGLQVTGE